MCNLNILIKTTLDGSRRFCKFLKNVTNSSYQTNKDGDGIYFSGTQTLVKSVNKIKVNRYVEDIRISDFIITHQRISTSGFSGEYTQPFEDSDFVLAHNGIMSDFIETGKTHSDTYSFFDKFKAAFAKQTGTRQANIVKTIKELLDDQDGSYSIVIYDKLENSMYYFKNFGTAINFHKSTDSRVLYITTSWSNDKYLKRLTQEFKDKDIEDQTIYKITIVDNQKISIRKIDKIKKKDCTWRNNTSYTQTAKEVDEDIAEYNKGFLATRRNFRQIDAFAPCMYCGESTDWVDLDGYLICRNCQDIPQHGEDRDGIPHINGYTPPQVKTLEKVYDKIEIFEQIYNMDNLTKRQLKKYRKLNNKKERLMGLLEDIADGYC